MKWIRSCYGWVNLSNVNYIEIEKVCDDFIVCAYFEEDHYIYLNKFKTKEEAQNYLRKIEGDY